MFSQPVQQTPENIGSMAFEVVGELLKLIALGLWAVLKHPVISVPLALIGGVVYLAGPAVMLALALTVVTVLAGWRMLHPDSFRAYVAKPARKAWRRVWRYQLRWTRAMRACGLVWTHKGSESVPKLGRIVVGEHGDRVRVRMVPGQAIADYSKVAAELAQSFGAGSCRVSGDRPGRVWLDLRTGEPLKDIVPALSYPETVDLRAVPIGQREDGTPLCIPLLWTHLLCVGATGAGKGSVMWSMIRGMAPAVRDGLVQLWGVDLKSGMELRPGRELFTRLLFDDADDWDERLATLLADAVTLMRERAARLADEDIRRHEPSVQEPFVLIVIDEVGVITDKDAGIEPKVQKAIMASIRTLLRRGRGVGVSVAIFTQDPDKQSLSFRSNIPHRILLRCDDQLHVNMALGQGARERGALCDQIGKDQQGVGFMRVEDDPDPVRFRAAFPTTDDIKQMASEYRPGAPERFRVDTSGTELVAIGVDLNKAFGG